MNLNKDIRMKCICNAYVKTIYIFFSKSCHTQIISQFSNHVLNHRKQGGKFLNQYNLSRIFCPQETIKRHPCKCSLYKHYFAILRIFRLRESTPMYTRVFRDFYPGHTCQLNLVIHTSFQQSPIFLKIIYIYNVLNEQHMFNARG